MTDQTETLLTGEPTAPAQTTAEPVSESLLTGDPDPTPTTEAPAAEAAPVIPEQYDFQFPEDQALDEASVEQLKALAKAGRLTQAQAQDFANLGVEMVKRWQDAHVTTLRDTTQQWAQAARQDPELGTAFAANLGRANAAIRQLGSPELLTFLKDSGLCNHPELIRAFYRASQLLPPDRLPDSTRRPSARKLEDLLYPSHP